MKKIVFLGSGGGGNLKFIHAFSKAHDSFFNIVHVITDRHCGAMSYAKEERIPCKIMSFKREISEDRKLMDLISTINPDYIITNVHKILSKVIVNKFQGQLLNLHYSYLPAYQGSIGMDPVDQALKRNNRFIGCTVHFVDENVDAGKTISQGVVICSATNNIYQSVFECGALTLLAGLFKMSGLQFVNYKTLNEYIISPFPEKIDWKIVKSIFLTLKKQQ